eukprot:8376984-Alexandrium_andersonii.AAC.1
MSSCSTAVRDVYQAERAANAAKAAKEKASKEEAARKRRKPNAPGQDPPNTTTQARKTEFQIFNFDPAAGRSNFELERVEEKFPAEWPLNKPLVITAAAFQNMYNDQGHRLAKECSSFLDIFNQSSQKVSYGRGQRRFEDTTAASEVAELFKDCSCAWCRESGWRKL